MRTHRVETAASRLPKNGTLAKAASAAEEQTRPRRVEAAACRLPKNGTLAKAESAAQQQTRQRRVEAAACRFSARQRAWQARLPCKTTRLAGASTLAFLVAGFANAATLTVALDGSGDHTRIDTAITASVDGDAVLVKPGEYDLDEPLDFRGKAIAIVGEAGAAATVLRLTVPEKTDLASVVIFASREGPDTRLEGLTLTGGRGVRSCAAAACPRRGGAIYCSGASPTLKDLVVTGNTADFGGGIYLAGDAEPAVIDCVVEKNTATIGGGICIAAGSRARVAACTITANRASTGGGIHASNAAPTIEASIIRDNTAGSDNEGGGVYLGDATRVVLLDCTIEHNTAGKGGGVSCARSAARLEGCVIIGNRAGGDRLECSGQEDLCIRSGGGGVRCLQADPEFVRCRISGNTAGAGDGGGVQLEFSSPVFSHCVLSGNVAGRGGALFASVGEPRLDRCTVAWNSGNGDRFGAGGIVSFGTATPIRVTSSIVWGNSGGSFSSNVWSLDVTNSCVEGGQEGEGNISEDPRFCGWTRDEIFVDQNAQTTGDGSPERPFCDLKTAVDHGYSLALRADSPLRGSGEGGTDIGADLGTCEDGHATAEVTIHLAPGTYQTPAFLLGGVNIQGAGAEETILFGTLRLLSTVSRLSGLTLTGGDEGGVIVWAWSTEVGADVELRDAVVRGNDGPGVFVGSRCHQPSSTRLVNCVVRDNRGPGVQAGAGVSVVLERCTVTGNLPLTLTPGGRSLGAAGCEDSVRVAGGVIAQASATIVSSIIWDNAGSEVSGGAGRVTFSCIEGGRAGEGNIDLDPGFCGWSIGPEIAVDDIQVLVRSAFNLSLSADSPCRGSGEGGVDMGADLGVCDAPGDRSLHLCLAPGTYPVAGLSFAHIMSIEGAGPGETILDGTVSGLLTGAVLSGVSVTDGIVILDEAPRIVNVAIDGPAGAGVQCLGSAAPEIIGCTLVGRETGQGILCDGRAAPRIEGCRIFGYESGVSFSGLATPILVNTIVARSRGSCISILGAPRAPTLIHCTLIAREDGLSINAPTGTAIVVKSSIVAGDLSVEGGALLTVDHSLIVPLPAWRGHGNVSGDPRFVDPDAGDYRLLPHSRAIDAAGTDTGVMVDIDGRPRPCGAAPDMGAYEMGGCEEDAAVVHFLRSDCNHDGEVNLSDAICILEGLFLGVHNVRCVAATNANGDTTVNITDPVYLLGHLFGGGPAPPAPFPECGPSVREADDLFGCATSCE